MDWEKIKTDSPPEVRAMFGYVSYFQDDKQYFAVFGGSTYNGESNDFYR